MIHHPLFDFRNSHVEAVLVLYSKNSFSFRGAESLESFSSRSLARLWSHSISEALSLSIMC